jgi:hypothetical protein
MAMLPLVVRMNCIPHDIKGEEARMRINKSRVDCQYAWRSILTSSRRGYGLTFSRTSFHAANTCSFDRVCLYCVSTALRVLYRDEGDFESRHIRKYVQLRRTRGAIGRLALYAEIGYDFHMSDLVHLSEVG